MSKGQILVVDDEMAQREILRTILTTEGFGVDTAKTAAEALEKGKRQQFDLVLTDLKMPGEDGLTLVRDLSREDPPTLVVIMTGHGSLDTAEQAMQKGRPVELKAALASARALIAAARQPVALVSSWGSNEELSAFSQALGSRFTSYVKTDWLPVAGERLEDEVLIKPDKNPNTAAARKLYPALPPDARSAFPPDTDLVLVWGEGFAFAQLPPKAKIIYLNSYLQPENGHADVFLPISVQTERSGHYTNFQGVVSAFAACFDKKPGVSDAAALFASLTVPARLGATS